MTFRLQAMPYGVWPEVKRMGLHQPRIEWMIEDAGTPSTSRTSRPRVYVHVSG